MELDAALCIQGAWHGLVRRAHVRLQKHQSWGGGDRTGATATYPLGHWPRAQSGIRLRPFFRFHLALSCLAIDEARVTTQGVSRHYTLCIALVLPCFSTYFMQFLCAECGLYSCGLLALGKLRG